MINNLKFEYPDLQKWTNFEIINRISNNWKNRNQIQTELNMKIFERTKSIDLKEREEKNPENIIEVGETAENNDILESLISEDSDTIDWNKAFPMTRYANEAPPIILDNIEEVTEINICTNEVQMRNLPSKTDLIVLTSHYYSKLVKWLESRRASHPFISVKMKKINPRKNNADESKCTSLCLMADSGAM